MTEVPKIVPTIVYDRLRAASPERALPERTGPEQAHPDADLLTAFAEQSLSATERDGVLEHLALCGDCREVIALALPAADIVAAPVVTETEAVRATPILAKDEKRGGLASRVFAWPSLPWAALAAGVAVAASVLLLHPGRLNQATTPPANPPVATTAQPIPGPQIASSPLPPPMAAVATDQPAEAARTEARLKPELRLSKKFKAGQVVTPSLQAKSEMLLAENKIADNKKDSKEAGKVPAASSAGARLLDYNASAIPRSNEAVEVTAESPIVQAEVSSEDRPMARNGAPAIAKAKPAPQTETSQQQNTTSATVGELPLQSRNRVSMAKSAAPPPSPTRARAVTWTVTAGVLQRSLDSGQSWQNALRSDHPLLCYASHDEDVWTGGQAGTLFHSGNSGITWVQVQPSIKGQALSSDITHIDLRGDLRGDVRGPAEIVVSTSNNEIWSSADGGKTWEKK